MLETLRGVLAQERVELEVVVVDDGSRDRTRQRVAELRDERLTVVGHADPRGVAAARNAGLRAAQGAWVAFLDDDDLWAPSKLHDQLAAARASRASVACSAVVNVDHRLRVVSTMPPPAPDGLASALLARNVVPAGASNVLVERELALEHEGFDESLFHFADWDLWLRLARSAPWAAVPAVHVAYVHHPGSMLSGAPRQALGSEIERLRSKHAQARAAAGVALDEGDIARWVRRERRSRVAMPVRTWLRPARLPADLSWLEPYRAARSPRTSSSAS